MGSRPNRILAIAVGAVVVLAAVVVAFSANRAPAELDVNTPEGTVQTYLSAVFAGDYAKAAQHLDPQSGCDVADLDRLGTVEPARAYLVDSAVDGDTARVTVDVTTPAGGGPLDPSESSESHIFRLARSGQGWRLSGIPWPLYECEGAVK